MVDLPTETDEMYDSVIRRINEQHPDRRDSAMRALLWVTYATRSLSLDELVTVIRLSSEDEGFYESGWVDAETLLASCFGLINVEKDTRKTRLMRTWNGTPPILSRLTTEI
jgi:ankyrin repeat domain-containing protein 50